MLGGVKLADYADNKAFFGDARRRFRLRQHLQNGAGDVPRAAPHQAQLRSGGERGPPLSCDPVERQVLGRLSEPPIEYKEPPKGATPIATQRRSIYFETNSAKMGLDSRAVVDEIGDFMRAYENTVVDIEGNTDSTGSRGLNMELSQERAEAVKKYLVEKYDFPPARMRTVGNGPDRPVADNTTPEGREKNRRTDIKVFRIRRVDDKARPLADARDSAGVLRRRHA